MQRYAIVDTTSNRVLTVVEYDVTPTTPPSGFPDGVIAVQNDAAGSNWTWDGTQLVAPTPVVTPSVPVAVSPRQGRLALLSAGLLDKATAAVNAAGGATLITWEYATAWERNDPLIISLGASLGLTSDQIDQLFATAANL
ncbi:MULTISPECIES: hypothetical protein [unclassified Bradyrhizobium]|uniref:hypothetical protein n=1 Tax=unclassified Bradyrhizobium TaxID=2631580 RepID=UPI002916E223|nr:MULTISPECIES: hypothetical protein [unclassified Bradyrhizobium]